MKKQNSPKRVIKAWHYTLCDFDRINSEDVIPEDGCVLIAMEGYTRFQDFYLCIPKQGVYTRSANHGRYGEGKLQFFIDGQFVGAGWEYKDYRVKALYEAGHVYEAEQYALGHMLWRETTLGGGHINERKKAARISHMLCDATGKAGHEARQYIRRQILNGANIHSIAY